MFSSILSRKSAPKIRQNMNKIWRIKDPDPAVQNEISSELKISKITAQLLINRGVNSISLAGDFMKSSLASCHDPFLLKDMDKAVYRIRKAISGGEKILVYGDYDVDGMTAVTVLFSALRNLGATVVSYIPNRLEEGYGLNIGAMRLAHKDGVNLVVTVDCGIGSFKEVEYANSLNMDVIITDHHELVESRIPDAYAVINPLQSD